MSRKPIDKPIAAVAEQGEVIVDGPDGVAFSIVPEVAVDLSDRLFDAAIAGRDQRFEEERRAARELRAKYP